jgi:hypothetical protein
MQAKLVTLFCPSLQAYPCFAIPNPAWPACLCNHPLSPAEDSNGVVGRVKATGCTGAQVPDLAGSCFPDLSYLS